MWMIRRPRGTIYSRKNLASLKAAYGGNKKELEAQGWLFVDLEAPKKKDTPNADNKQINPAKD